MCHQRVQAIVFWKSSFSVSFFTTSTKHPNRFKCERWLSLLPCHFFKKSNTAILLPYFFILRNFCFLSNHGAPLTQLLYKGDPARGLVGLEQSERLIPDAALLRDLAAAGIAFAVVTGRPAAEARGFLATHSLTQV